MLPILTRQLDAARVMVRNKVKACHFPNALKDAISLLAIDAGDPEHLWSTQRALGYLVLELDSAIDRFEAQRIAQASGLRFC